MVLAGQFIAVVLILTLGSLMMLIAGVPWWLIGIGDFVAIVGTVIKLVRC